MQFDSLAGVELHFIKNLQREKEGFGICVCSSKTSSRSEDVTNHIYVSGEGQRKTKTVEVLFNSLELVVKQCLGVSKTKEV